jgi:hypothetical protein
LNTLDRSSFDVPDSGLPQSVSPAFDTLWMLGDEIDGNAGCEEADDPRYREGPAR